MQGRHSAIAANEHVDARPIAGPLGSGEIAVRFGSPLPPARDVAHGHGTHRRRETYRRPVTTGVWVVGGVAASTIVAMSAIGSLLLF